MFDELEIDESLNVLNVQIGDKKSIVFVNDANECIDEEFLGKQLCQLKDIDKITTVYIDHSSKVRNCTFLKSIYNIKSLFIRGKNIKSIDGVESLAKLEYLEIGTGNKKKINIEKLSQSTVSVLSINNVRLNDYENLNKCNSIKDIRLSGCLKFDPQLIKDMKIEDLSLTKSKFEEIGNFNSLEILSRLDISYCNKLLRFNNGNDNIKYLTIQSCNNLNLATVTNFPNLESLVVNSCKSPINLSYFGKMKRVRNINIELCEVNIDNLGVIKELRFLKKIWVDGVAEDLLKKLSEVNKSIKVTSGKYCYENGVKRSLDYYYLR